MQSRMNLFLRIAVLFLVSAAFFFTSANPLLAQGPPDDGSRAGQTPNESIDTTTGDDILFDQPVIPGQTGPSEGVADDIAEINAGANGNTSGNTSGSGGVEGNEAEALVYRVSLGIGGFVTNAGGAIFDLAVDKVVLKMGCWFVDQVYLRGDCSGVSGTGAVGAVVNSLWTVVRDLFNILFIFALVYIGLRMILFSDESSTQRTLGMLIAAALLINFSLYFTKVIVDVANYTAVAVHEVASAGITLADGENRAGLAVTSENPEGETTTTTIGTGDAGSLSAAYMGVLRFSSWFSGDPITEGWRIIVFSIMMLLFLIILGITLAFGGIMLITRFIALVIFMILSPAMFLGWILPQFSRYSKMWWQKFLSYAFFAPAYIFMLYLGLYTLSQLSSTFNDKSYAGVFQGQDNSHDSFSIFLFFAMGIGFLFAATKVGQTMSVAGATTAMNTSQGVLRGIKNGGVRATKWGAGRVASSAVGGTAKRYGDWRDEKASARTRPRNRTERAVRSFIKKGEAAKFGGTTSYKDRTGADKEEAKSHARAHKVHEYSETLKLDDSPDNYAQKQQAFADMTDAQLLEVAKSGEGRENIIRNAHMLSAGQLKTIAGSEDLDDTKKSSIAGAYASKTNEVLTQGVSHQGAQIVSAKSFGKASTDQLNAVGYETLKNEDNVVHLTKEKIDKLNLVDSYKDDLKKRQEAAQLKVAQGQTVGGVSRADLLKSKAADIAKLPKEAFREAAFVQMLPESVVKSKPFSELDVAVQRDIRTHLEAIINNPPTNISQSDLNRITEIDGWLRSPGGRSFGR